MKHRGPGHCATVRNVAIIDSFYASLKQEGYAPHIGEGGVISFKYFGQECALRLQTLGTQVIAELEPGLEAAQRRVPLEPVALLDELAGAADQLVASHEAGSGSPDDGDALEIAVRRKYSMDR